MPDAIVEEIRRVRDEYARRFNYDLHAMCADLRREQDLGGARVVSFLKKPSAEQPTSQGAQIGTEKATE